MQPQLISTVIVIVVVVTVYFNASDIFWMLLSARLTTSSIKSLNVKI